MAQQREQWGSKIGVILAVAGSAIGLGNFLRFPVKAASFGGGAFLIPYFVAFLLLGIPLAWMEWTLGRYGGRYSHGSAPGILNAVVRKPWAKYLGSLGIIGPLLINFYYIYIESWLLGFAWYALTGDLMEAVSANAVGPFFENYILLKTTLLHGTVPAALAFFLATFFLNLLVVYGGIRRGIERISVLVMPIILVLGLILLARVLTLPNITQGLAFMWNPDFSALAKPRVWLEASGQIFFTLSIGIGAVLTYASYVKRKQDVALSSLSANAANEFAEVILGGTIVVPMAVVVFGAANIETIAKMGTFGLGFQTMPMIFGKMPLPQFFQFIWFALLFFAGVTSSISLLQPPIAFFEDELGMKRRSSILVTGAVLLAMGLLAVYGLGAGAVDEMDFWGGTVALVVFGTVEAILFSWVFGIERGWKELNEGSQIRIPRFFKFVLQWVTPTYLVIILVTWFITDFRSVILLEGVDRAAQVPFLGMMVNKVHFITGLRLVLVGLLLAINAVIFFAWRKRKLDDKLLHPLD
ncbi:MAG: sodium:calcium symporter [Spirochaetes bacterium]|nr:sodium:calcium symporter [Spirochaetota bacterium]